VAQTEDRARALVEIGIALSSELSLESLLQRIVEAAAELTGARYAALGVIDPSGHALERFVTAGIPLEQHAEIGELPRGRGILGVLIRDAKPLRLRALGEDPRSVGFPPGHPPMSTFLGVPILLRGVAYGNLYLTEKHDGDFTEEDEELVQLLAAQAAVAIENARLYESATKWASQLESLNEVMSALVSEFELGPLLQKIAARLRDLIGARLVVIVLPRQDGLLRVEAAAGDGAGDLHGEVLGPRSKSARVLERRRVERVDSVLEDPEVDQEFTRRFGVRAGLFVPLVVREQAIGVMAAHDKHSDSAGRFSDEDRRIAEIFADRASVAVDLSRRVAQDALRRIVTAQELERRRLARELHDETGQALTSILLGLRSVEEAKTVDEAREAGTSLRELVLSTLQDVRRLAVELRPKALDDFGLVPALERLTSAFAEQTALDVDFQALLPDRRLPTEVETTLYRIVQEALTNIVKHARAQRVSVLLTRKDGSVSAVIEDDGVGFDPTRIREGGLGLLGMRERVALVGGRIEIETDAGAGTTLVAEVPL
jgi:two-component system, NarL family, sensor histidine kinase DevS